MKPLKVVWRPRARDNLLALYDWIEARSDSETAYEYTSGIEAFAHALGTYPERGTPRDDLLFGLRTMVYRRRTVISYRIIEGKAEVLALVRAGQDWSNVTLD